MSFAYAIGIAINWGNEACILTFTTTFGLNHIVMILHKGGLAKVPAQVISNV